MKVKCPQCKMEFNMAEDLVARLGDWTCAACWYEKLTSNDRSVGRLRWQGGDRKLVDDDVKPVEKSI